MLLLILAFIVSLVPAFFFYRWLKKQPDMEDGYAGYCRKALIAGFVAVVPVVLGSLTLHVLGNLLHFKEQDPILYRVYWTFLVLALVEEAVKFLMMRRVIRDRACSWLEITIFMALVGLGFEIVEAIPYAIGANPITMFVRGATLMHMTYGFVTGYFYGRARHEKDNVYAVCGFLLVWLMHGLYDFTLSDEVLDINEAIAAVPLALAAFSVVLVFLFIRFVKKARQEDRYLEECTE